MAAFAHVRDMNDVALRPRLLRCIVREHVPDDKRPFGSPSQLSKVISMVKTHGLLFESAGDGAVDQKLLAGWRSAVDSWIERLSQLVSNDMPDKCWAGVCLLGVTCQECSSDRFLASYSTWFQKLLSQIQLAEASYFVKVASCASMSDLLTRLGGFPSVKKDATALATRVVQPVLKLLSDDQSEATWDGAVHLLCTITSFFPFAISRHYETVEASIASKFLSGNCSFDMLKKLAYCLALLPKSKGDEDSWSLLMHKILLRINSHLNDTLQGFEEDYKAHEAVRLLAQPGKELPPPFGELESSEPSSAKKRPKTLTTSSISALMLCCCTMLTSSFPVQVTVPVRSLLSLVERVLMVNGSLQDSQRPYVTAMQQEFLSSELPVLHQHSLELLTAIIKSVRSQLLPHAASIVRLVSFYFKRCALPELRTQMYSITKTLLISMGVGMAVCIAQEVVNNAMVDLSPVGFRSGGISSSATAKPSTEVLPNPSRKKRKHGAATTVAPEEGPDGISLEVGALNNTTPKLVSLRTAALEAVEALLTVGGSIRSEGWRSNLDLLLINIAKSSLQEGWASEERSVFQASQPSEIRANMQLAALRALLASFLSSRVRSPYLAQGLELFREGRQETGSKLAEFCAHALLTMEVLIHPRTLQADDFPAANCFPDEVKHKFSENNFSSMLQGMGRSFHDSDQDDDLCDNWLEKGKEQEVTVGDPIIENEKPSEISTVRQDIHLSGGNDIDKGMPGGRNSDSGVRGDSDLIMVESVRPNHQDSVTAPDDDDGSAGGDKKMVSERITSDIESSKSVGNDLASDKEAVVANTGGGFKLIIPDKGKALSGEMDDDSDMEDFPEIVIEDPDSDSDSDDDDDE